MILYSGEYINKNGESKFFAATDIFMINKIIEIIRENKLEITNFKKTDT